MWPWYIRDTQTLAGIGYQTYHDNVAGCGIAGVSIRIAGWVDVSGCVWMTNIPRQTILSVPESDDQLL